MSTTTTNKKESEMNLEFFGERVLYARKVVNDFSLTKIEKGTGVNRATISHWEKSKDKIGKVETLNLWKFCELCGVEFVWVFNGTGPIKKGKPNNNEEGNTLPIINWNDLILHKNGSNPQEMGRAETPAYIATDNRCAVTTVPEDMIVEFNKGDRIIIDPDSSPGDQPYLIYNLDDHLTIVSYIELPGGRKHISALSEKAQLQNYDPKLQIAIIKGKWYQ